MSPVRPGLGLCGPAARYGVANIAALAEMAAEQREHWTRVLGDPLDWVRRRLGHSSVTTTQVYLHCLAELAMETRMALVPGRSDDPRDIPLAQIGDDLEPPPKPVPVGIGDRA